MEVDPNQSHYSSFTDPLQRQYTQPLYSENSTSSVALQPRSSQEPKNQRKRQASETSVSAEAHLSSENPKSARGEELGIAERVAMRNAERRRQASKALIQASSLALIKAPTEGYRSTNMLSRARRSLPKRLCTTVSKPSSHSTPTHSQIQAHPTEPELPLIMRQVEALPPGCFQDRDAPHPPGIPDSAAQGQAARTPTLAPALLSQRQRSSATDPSPVTAGRYGRALFDHNTDGMELDELILYKGDLVEVHSESNEGWWVGTTRGRTGLFPPNYVEEVTHYQALAAASGEALPHIAHEPRQAENVIAAANEPNSPHSFNSLAVESHRPSQVTIDTGYNQIIEPQQIVDAPAALSLNALDLDGMPLLEHLIPQSALPNEDNSQLVIDSLSTGEHAGPGPSNANPTFDSVAQPTAALQPTSAIEVHLETGATSALSASIVTDQSENYMSTLDTIEPGSDQSAVLSSLSQPLSGPSAVPDIMDFLPNTDEATVPGPLEGTSTATMMDATEININPTGATTSTADYPEVFEDALEDTTGLIFDPEDEVIPTQRRAHGAMDVIHTSDNAAPRASEERNAVHESRAEGGDTVHGSLPQAPSPPANQEVPIPGPSVSPLVATSAPTDNLHFQRIIAECKNLDAIMTEIVAGVAILEIRKLRKGKRSRRG